MVLHVTCTPLNLYQQLRKRIQQAIVKAGSLEVSGGILQHS
jgi:hypothetical protein